MPHPVTDKSQLARGPFEVSDYPDSVSDTTVAWTAVKLVHDVVDAVNDSAQLVVKYGSLSVENGRTLSPDILSEEPEVVIEGAGTYTLMLADVDAPSPKDPHHRSFLLWMVINIPAEDVARGEVAVEYEPPSPARGKHRYAFLLFKQSKRLVVRPPSKRHSFQVREWAQSHGLGHPASGLFFWSQLD